MIVLVFPLCDFEGHLSASFAYCLCIGLSVSVLYQQAIVDFQKVPWVNPVKELQIDVLPSQGFLQEHFVMGPELEHWDLQFTAGSFLRSQVKRLICY